MIFYNWTKIYKFSLGKASVILDIIYYVTHRPVPKNKWDRFYLISKENWAGNSFLLNPEQIYFHRLQYSNIEFAQYVALASLRNYADYKATNRTYLRGVRLPENINIDKLKENRLLTIDEYDNIYFLWEEVH